MIHLSKRESVIWAKMRSEGGMGEHLWLPLITHLFDTQSTINWLFNHWLSQEQQEILSQGLSNAATEKLVKFVGFTHDIGKATPAFQTKPSYNGDKSLDDEMGERLIRGGFAELDRKKLSSPSKSPHALAGEAILDYFEVPTSISAIIGGHHGKPTSSSPRRQIKVFTSNYWQSDNDQVLQQHWRDVQKGFFNYGLSSSGYQAVDELPNINQPQAVILEGLLIMADWLASSEHTENDLPLFPLIDMSKSWDDINMTGRFQQAIQNWYLDGEWVPQKVTTSEDPYQARWGFKARPVQSAMTEAIGKAVDPGMVIIEAPMGLGKTEIALIAAEQLAYIKGEDGLFMGLPTQATTNAMFGRVSDWLKLLAKSQGENFPIKLMHGKAQFNENYSKLPNASNIDNAGAVVVNSWFSGKKSILTKFTVGTIDHLLLMGLKQKHLFLRHLGFSGKVVVIDEAHAYDFYMNQYLYKAINWLGAYHVPIVILSATLPKEKRNALLKAYLKGKYGKKFKQSFEAPEGWQDTQAYPLLSLLDGNHLKQVTKFPGQSDQLPVKLTVQRVNAADEDLIQAVLKKISHGGIAGVIVNTVKRAQELAKLVPQDTKLMILHASFLAPAREKQEEQLQKAIGKHGNRPSKMIVIGTQVLEQSLDIDFDVLYTDIAPIDLILQRAGRLHRHRLNRPQALKMPQVFVMGINGFGDYGDANEAIYSKYLLMKTDHYLPETITLPDDISTLVQAVYDSATDSEVPDIDQAKLTFKTDFEREKQKARAFQIKLPSDRPNATIHGWLDRDQADVDKDEQKANAAVRDIKETLEVILTKHTAEGDFLLDGRKLSDVQPQEIAQQTIRIPAAVTPQIDLAIDRLETLTNLYYRDWQDSRWLKGALALPLNQDLSIDFCGWHLSYSLALGLSYTKEDEHG
ncbi:CRISPR-associated helicase Cas3' [Lentilactobacillus raoultii]|uniref:CRISPR-associated helicase Cas3 n=1 Tax=Lentilactobacillus raoultii TaxID=1987503 RepID=A0ABW3PDF2_9LACO|nr:CRISPR-associated helicase Cas3' [Lentilactobacillus raoultii]